MASLVSVIFNRCAVSSGKTNAIPRAGSDIIVHNIRFFTPVLASLGSYAARWGAAAMLTFFYFGQPRRYFQYLPYFGKYYNPKAKYLNPYLV